MQLWTQEHLRTLPPAFLLMLAASLLLRFFLKNKSLGLRRLPLQVIALLLILLEVGKQTTSYRDGYDLYHLPFHFCSFVMIALILAAFYRGRGEERVRGVAASWCWAAALMTLISPELIYPEHNIVELRESFLSFHTVAFHNLVILAALLILFLELYIPQKGMRKRLFCTTAMACGLSALMAQLLQTNYANMYRCHIEPLEELRLALIELIGATPTRVIYVTVVIALHLGFTQLSYLVYCLLRRALDRPAGQDVKKPQTDP